MGTWRIAWENGVERENVYSNKILGNANIQRARRKAMEKTEKKQSAQWMQN